MRSWRSTAATTARRTLAVLAAALPLAVAACDDSGTGADTQRDVTIGGIFSLTGNWATLGVTSKAALELAVADVNQYATGRGIHFVARTEDTKLDPATALAKVQALHDAGVQVVIGPQSSAELAAIKSYVDANDLLVVSQSSTAGSLAVANDAIFRFTPSDSLEGAAISALMWADGIRAVVPMWRADAGNQGLHTATAAKMTSLGATVSTGVEYSATATDYTASIAALKTQVHQALAGHSAGQVGVYLAGFDEVADVFALAAADPELSSVRWYGSDGVALSAAVLAKPAAVAFAEKVGYPNPVFGLDPAAQERWKPVYDRIQTQAGQAPDAFALGVYDAVWVAALTYLASPAHVNAADLKTRFVATSASYYGVTGWTALNAAGDRKYADFDFWGIRASGATHAWTRVASYDTRLGVLTR